MRLFYVVYITTKVFVFHRERMYIEYNVPDANRPSMFIGLGLLLYYT